jgi:hypothetical protein
MGGYGDAIMWLRFIESLLEVTTAHIFWDAEPILAEFVQYNVRHLDRVSVIDANAADAPFDRHLSATSLPEVIGAIPPFRRRLAPAPVEPPLPAGRARIGLAWACNIHVPDHLERSIPLGVLAPLFWRPDVEFYSLQVGLRASDGYYYPVIQQPDPPLESFTDTANLIAGLDAVVTVDTSVAHLASSLDVPTLTMLEFACDAKWGFGTTTPWYPSMRLIRQRTPRDWISVEGQVRQALDARWWAG